MGSWKLHGKTMGKFTRKSWERLDFYGKNHGTLVIFGQRTYGKKHWFPYGFDLQMVGLQEGTFHGDIMGIYPFYG